MRTGLWMKDAARPWAVGLMVVALAGIARAGDEPCDEACCEEGPTAKQLAEGRTLFLREWTAGKTAHGGDGLGPVFNDSSCVACHNAGGTGGGGPNSKNVDIITASQNQVFAAPSEVTFTRREPRFLDRAMEALLGIEPPPPPSIPTPVAPPGVAQAPKADRRPLIAAHAGFRTANSVVLHRFSTEPAYDDWRRDMLGQPNFGMPGQGGQMEMQNLKVRMQNQQFMGRSQKQVGAFGLLNSQRNPTALFGSGLIDRIPDAAIEAQAKVKHEDFPEIQGRVARRKDGRIGRFGWKGQTPSLEDFVLTACAVELGLEVPGHPQGGLPSKPDYKPEGLDLTAEECASLTAYVKALAKPARVNADHPDVVAGERAFRSIGCATCHTQKLGDVEGIYSDLLVHDLGPELGDVGQYGVFVPDSAEPEIEAEPQEPIAAAEPVVEGAVVQQVVVEAAAPAAVVEDVAQVAIAPEPVQTFEGQVFMGMGGMGGGFGIAPRPKSGPAGRQEWRTPPLWGLRDSGPYLHDGRASTVDEAVAMHGGEATRVAMKYFDLSPQERQQLQAFLKSLTAPDDTSLAVAGK